MSILDSLKLLNKPINELAMLPQQTIIQLSQSHPREFPPAYVSAVLGQKAEQAKAGAQAAAMMQQQQLPPSTVMERVIAENAASEAGSEMGMPPRVDAPVETPMMQMPPQPEPPLMPPQMPPGDPMAEAGLASLPISEAAIPAQYAGGGIIAFDNGGEVQRFQNQGLVDSNRITGEAVKPTEQLSEFEKNLLSRQALYDRFMGKDQAAEDLIKYTQEAEKRAASDADRAFYRRIFKAGMNILGETSPDPFVNIGKGVAPEIEGHMGDMDKQRASELERKKALVELQNKRRAEKSNIFKEIVDSEDKIKAAVLAASTKDPTDTKEFAALAVIAQGPDKAAADIAKTKMDAMLRFAEARAVSGAIASGGPERARAAIARVGTEQQRVDLQRHRAALEYAQKHIKSLSGQQELITRRNADNKANKASGAKPGDPNYQDSVKEFEDSLYAKGYDQKFAPKSEPATAPKDTLGTKKNPLPMPKTAAEAQVGKVYLTSKGLATWNGKQFVPVK